MNNPQLSIISPYNITAANISTSNVALEALWNSATAYAIGDIVRYGDFIWRAVTASTNVIPSNTATQWLNIGPPNRFACFDIQGGGLDQYRVVETVTTNSDSIEYTLTDLGRVSGIAFFGLRAASIEIVATQTTTGDVLNYLYNMRDLRRLNGSFWNYCFLPLAKERDHILRGLSIPPSCTITIRVINTGSTAQVGSIV
jgi:hypothetical protein